jgi:hypothetical protein
MSCGFPVAPVAIRGGAVDRRNVCAPTLLATELSKARWPAGRSQLPLMTLTRARKIRAGGDAKYRPLIQTVTVAAMSQGRRQSGANGNSDQLFCFAFRIAPA